MVDLYPRICINGHQDPGFIDHVVNRRRTLFASTFPLTPILFSPSLITASAAGTT
jgi:hypothetical protein